MIVAACPSCREHVTVPVDARPTSIVRCPLCNAECRLEEFLAQLPPPLIVVTDAGAGVDDAAARSASAALDMTSDHDRALDIGGPLELDERLPAFDFTPVPTAEDAAGPREIVWRPARRQANPAWEIAKIVGGALLAVPAAQIILWWCVPYDWKRDLLGIGPSVSRVVPWVVPTKFRAVSDAERFEAEDAAPHDNTAVALQRRSGRPPRPWRSNLPEPDSGRPASAQDADTSPTVIDLTGETPLGEPATGMDLDVPSPERPPTIPGPEPSGDTTTDQPPRTAVPNERPSADGPGVTKPGAVGLPRYGVADLRVALEQALQASVAWDTSPDQSVLHRASLNEEFYRALAELGEIMAFMTPGDDNARELAADVHVLLAPFERQPKKLALIGNRTAEWLDQPARPNQGIFLFGTVGQIQPQGVLFATDIELASLKKRTVSVVSRIDPTRFYAPGDHILMFGALIGDPAQNLPGYEGRAAVVVLGSFPMRLR